MDNIDAIIEAELPDVAENEALETEQAETPENETAEEKEERRLTEAEWLKKERNTVSRRDKQIGKLRAQYEAAQAELQKYQQQAQTTTKPEGRPDPNDPKWKNLDEYIDALSDWKLDNFEKKSAVTQQSSVRNYQEQQFIQQSDIALQQATLEYAKIVPNIEEMIQEHGQTISNFPEGIKRAIREIDPQDVIKAFHAMVENDTLEDLADMTPTRAAAAIVKAASMQKPPIISRAPAPMASAKGTSQGSKTLNRMSPQELVDWVNS